MAATRSIIRRGRTSTIPAAACGCSRNMGEGRSRCCTTSGCCCRPDDAEMVALTAEQAYGLACDHYRNTRFVEAESLCRQVLRAVPGHRDALLLLAILAQRGGRTTEGDDYLRQAVESKDFSITLDTRLDSRPRWSPHAGLSAILPAGRVGYRESW